MASRKARISAATMALWMETLHAFPFDIYCPTAVGSQSDSDCTGPIQQSASPDRFQPSTVASADATWRHVCRDTVSAAGGRVRRHPPSIPFHCNFTGSRPSPPRSRRDRQSDASRPIWSRRPWPNWPACGLRSNPTISSRALSAHYLLRTGALLAAVDDALSRPTR